MIPPMPVILRGDARALPLPDESVDLVVTSPPYWSLRAYTDGGEAYDGQIGAEPTWQEYLDNLIACTREWMRVLKPSGSCWINLGDKFAQSTERSRNGIGGGLDGGKPIRSSADTVNGRVPNKCLLLLPHRYAIRCVDELGLIVRQDQVWAKANGLPESVTDRTRRSHEYFFHLVKQPRYYAAVDEIRESTQGRPGQMTWEQRKARGDDLRQGEQRGTFGRGGMAENPLGKLPGSVWEIPTQPLSVPAALGIDHFAAMPMEWPRRLILGWSPREVCTACGEGRRPVTRVEKTHAPRPSKVTALTEAHGKDGREGARPSSIATITGYACACPDSSAPATPGVVLDPFGGTGTTALVATMLGRRGISVDLSADYCRLAEWRASDPKERARAAGLDPDEVAKLRPQLPGQFDLFGEAAS